MRKAAAAVALAAVVGGCATPNIPPFTYSVTAFIPVPVVFFVYPGAGATGVSPSIGELVGAGSTRGTA